MRICSTDTENSLVKSVKFQDFAANFQGYFNYLYAKFLFWEITLFKVPKMSTESAINLAGRRILRKPGGGRTSRVGISTVDTSFGELLLSWYVLKC